MAITLKTQKMLWGRAAGRCSMPDCRIELVEDASETDDEALVGEICHIEAEKDDGPRGNANISLEQRNRYSNLILLCANHHTLIDSQPNEYSKEKLLAIKKSHELWVRQKLGLDDEKQHDDEHFADIIEKWETLTHIDRWDAWTSSILSFDQPTLDKAIDEDLYLLRIWLLNRVWPERYVNLKIAFDNFRSVLSDFQNLFRTRVENFESSRLTTRKFYKDLTEWNPELHRKLVDEYDFHVNLVEDLALELTRAANLICHRLRRKFYRSYRLAEGHLYVTYGPLQDLSYRRIVPLYSEDEKSLTAPYPGFRKFMQIRKSRDYAFGDGERDVSLYL